MDITGGGTGPPRPPAHFPAEENHLIWGYHSPAFYKTCLNPRHRIYVERCTENIHVLTNSQRVHSFVADPDPSYPPPTHPPTVISDSVKVITSSISPLPYFR